MKEPFILKETTNIMSHSHGIIKDLKLVAGFTTKNGGVSTRDFQTLNTGFHVQDKPKMCREIVGL